MEQKKKHVPWQIIQAVGLGQKRVHTFPNRWVSRLIYQGRVSKAGLVRSVNGLGPIIIRRIERMPIVNDGVPAVPDKWQHIL